MSDVAVVIVVVVVMVMVVVVANMVYERLLREQATRSLAPRLIIDNIYLLIN